MLKPSRLKVDARQGEILIHQLNLRSAKSLATPGVKSASSDIGLALPLEKHTPLRSMRTRASYLSEDWPDVRFASGEPQLSSYRRRFHTGETHEKLAHMLNSLVRVSSWVKIGRKLPTCQTLWSVSVIWTRWTQCRTRRCDKRFHADPRRERTLRLDVT